MAAQKKRSEVTKPKKTVKRAVAPQQVKEALLEKDTTTTVMVAEIATVENVTEPQNEPAPKPDEPVSENIEAVGPAEQDAEQDVEQEIASGGSMGKYFMWLFGAILFLLALGAFVYFAYLRGIAVGEQNMREKAAVRPTPQEKLPTPTPEEEKKDAYSIIIENGSGIGGEAGRAKTLLEDKDYTIASVGNADTSDYQDSVIKAKDDVPSSWLEALKKSLEDTYVVAKDVEKLGENESSDVIIIVGSTPSEK